MSTRAALYIQTDDGDWNQIYVHYDGNPKHMMRALASADPEQLIEAREIRSICADGSLDPFTDRIPFATYVADPHFPSWACHAYVLTATGWKWARDHAALETICAA